ncbi:hypothetical protein [Hespellia stercorisuis]|uniref:hypothetical protein n=1 Tax=Hespellia stercorisuis TaxID=180311 RepID=UPI000933B5B7|nr:hypothetical protein [Hespellia stercorisuis]
MPELLMTTTLTEPIDKKALAFLMISYFAFRREQYHSKSVIDTDIACQLYIGGFFNVQKNIFKNFSEKRHKSHFAVQIWCGKREMLFKSLMERRCDL